MASPPPSSPRPSAAPPVGTSVRRGEPSAAARLAGLAEALLDLVLPVECVVCGEPGTGLCPVCADDLGAALSRPTRVEEGAAALPVGPDGAVLPVMAAGLYTPPLAPALLAFKDHHALHLRGPLSQALARAVAALRLEAPDPRARGALLLPVPGSAAGFRRRGYDPLEELCRGLPDGWVRRDLVRPARPRPLPGRAEGAQRSHAGADARARRRRTRGWRPRPGRVPPGTPVILLDDVLTTGATLAALHEAALRAGAVPVGAAVVAGVPPPRRTPPSSAEAEDGRSGPLVRGVLRE